jgi:hypothetical protein
MACIATSDSLKDVRDILEYCQITYKTTSDSDLKDLSDAKSHIMHLIKEAGALKPDVPELTIPWNQSSLFNRHLPYIKKDINTIANTCLSIHDLNIRLSPYNWFKNEEKYPLYCNCTEWGRCGFFHCDICTYDVCRTCYSDYYVKEFQSMHDRLVKWEKSLFTNCSSNTNSDFLSSIEPAKCGLKQRTLKLQG